MIEVIPCGTNATIKLSNIPATISAIEISFDSVMYKLSYVNNGEIQTAWLNEKMFITGQHTKQIIGFKNQTQ